MFRVKASHHQSYIDKVSGMCSGINPFTLVLLFSRE